MPPQLENKNKPHATGASPWTRHLGIPIAMIFLCGTAAGQDILPFGSSWEYLHPLDGRDPAIADPDFAMTWHTPVSYDGGAFHAPAPATLGYGGIARRPTVTNIGTPLAGKGYTAYFRTAITTSQAYDQLRVEIFADDGGVLYIDGKMTGRLNFSAPDNYFALTDAESIGSETRAILTGPLEAGEHVIAFSLHNRSNTSVSSDLGFDLRIVPSSALEDITWVVSEGEVTITQASRNVTGTLVLPDRIAGLPVTRIGASALANGLWSRVTIPDSVTTIGNSAFFRCTGLTSVTIPDSVTVIGNDAFSGCTRLTGVTIPESVTAIGNGVFSGCAGLTSVTIPDGVTSIGNESFNGCTGLTGVTIPDSVTSIGNLAFFRCKGLTGVTIPHRVTVIGHSAFSLCTGLKDVTIPDGVTSIGNDAFNGCTGLTGVTIPDSVTEINDGVFSGCTGLTKVTIPDSVTAIGRSAFVNCTGLTGVTIPGSVKSIGMSAFYGCTGLTDVRIPDSVNIIVDFAFFGCTGLTSVTIPDSVVVIGYSAFSGCTGLTNVTIPDSVTAIGDRLFYGCTGLTNVTIPDSVTAIGNDAFSGCTGLMRVTFLGEPPRAVVAVGFTIFQNPPLGAQALVRSGYAAAFGGAGAQWNGLTVTMIPVSLGETRLDGRHFTIRFSGEPEVTGWKVTGSSTVEDFGDDLTSASVLTETAPGEYEAVVDVTGKPERYFLRVGR